MGKGGGCSTVGYGYSLTMLYAFCEKADTISGWKVNDKIWWQDDSLLDVDTPLSTFSKYLYTGKKGEVYSSDYDDHSNLTFYLQNYTPISYPQNTIGYDIKINNITFAYMDNVFIGDNTTMVPKYEVRLSRYWILGNKEKIGQGSVNPIAVILDFFLTYMEIDSNNIDWDSFNYAKNICSEEGLGISFLMTTEKDVVSWIKEILRTVDGALYFDTTINKWKIKLFRKDYNPDDCFVISEENASSIKITSGSWDTIINSFTFKYSNILSGQTESFTIENSALFNVVGYKIHKEYTFQLVGENYIMSQIANRILKKNSKPLYSLKARISILDLPNIELGSVVKVKSTELNIPEKLFRIIKIGADSEDDIYVDIEGIEEVWNLGNVDNIIEVPDINNNNVAFFDLKNLPPYKTEIIELPSIFYNVERKQPVALITSYPENYERNVLISGAKNIIDVENVTSYNKAYYYGELDTEIPTTNNSKLNDIEIILKPTTSNNIYCELPVINQTEENWQKLQYIIIIDKEIFAIKNLETIDSDNHIYKITGLIRLNDKQETHSKGAMCYLTKITNISDIVSYNTDSKNMQYKGYLYNTYSTSEGKESNNYTLNKPALKPLSPASPYVFTNSNGEDVLKFRNRARGIKTECIYKNCDTITAGELENSTEITKLKIVYSNGIKYYNLPDISNGTYTIILNDGITKDNILRIAVTTDAFESDEVEVYKTETEIY